MPDPVLGEAVCAFVALHPGRTLELSELVALLDAQGIARFKLPARLQLIDHLPLTNVGKVSKAALREEIAQRLEMENQAAATIADRPA
jgi:non-ribosomal peptide synthetase component E (peptide arylation enzyme)